MAMRGFTPFSFRRHAKVVKPQPILVHVRINSIADGLLSSPWWEIIQARKEMLG
jgi:hypothetical protein